MKINVITSILTLVLLSFIFSCKQDAKAEKQENQSIEKIDKELKIAIGLKTNQEEVFKINLNNIKVDDFQKKTIQIKETIPVNSSFESIVARFGIDNISNDLKINLGNSKVKRVIFNGIELEYGENKILITKSNFNTYFRINRFVQMDSLEFSFYTLKVDGKHTPELIARKKLIDFLKK